MKKIEHEHGSVIISGDEDHEDVNVDLESLYESSTIKDDNLLDTVEPLEIYIKLADKIELFGKLISLKLEKDRIKIKYEINNNQNELFLQLSNLISSQVSLKEIKLQQSSIKPQNFVLKSFSIKPNQENQQYSCCSFVFEQ